MRLHCYLVLEHKTNKLKLRSEWAGKLSFSISAIDCLFRTVFDAKVTGLPPLHRKSVVHMCAGSRGDLMTIGHTHCCPLARAHLFPDVGILQKS